MRTALMLACIIVLVACTPAPQASDTQQAPVVEEAPVVSTEQPTEYNLGSVFAEPTIEPPGVP